MTERSWSAVCGTGNPEEGDYLAGERKEPQFRSARLEAAITRGLQLIDTGMSEEQLQSKIEEVRRNGEPCQGTARHDIAAACEHTLEQRKRCGVELSRTGYLHHPV